MHLADGEAGHLFQNHVPSIENADILLGKDWPFSNLAIVKKTYQILMMGSVVRCSNQGTWPDQKGVWSPFLSISSRLRSGWRMRSCPRQTLCKIDCLSEGLTWSSVKR